MWRKQMVVSAAGLLIAGTAPAAVVAEDHSAAGVYSADEGGWQDGDNGGEGFGAWRIATDSGTGGYAGAFIGDPTAAGIEGLGTSAFGLFANPGGSNASVGAYRSFAQPLAHGDTFSFTLGINWDSGDGGGNKGFNLYSGDGEAVQEWNLNNGGSPVITCAGSASATLFSTYGTHAMTFRLQVLEGNRLRVQAVGRDGVESFDQTFSLSAAPTGFKFYAHQMQSGDTAQPYFDQLQVIHEDTAPDKPETDPAQR